MLSKSLNSLVERDLFERILDVRLDEFMFIFSMK
jgi:hypothetical protein